MADAPAAPPLSRPLVVAKARVEPVADSDTEWVRLVFGYLSWATAWLVFGTLVGEYVGIKFVLPDLEHVPWLGFGRLRPVHTNTVFWGWSTLAMISMALYVVPKTSRRRLHSFPMAHVSLWLINAAVLIGHVLLMSGISNGGQEYREYIWTVQAVFALGVILVAYNLIRTIAARNIEEIYISNWYIMGGFLWTIALLVIAYVPWYQQDGRCAPAVRPVRARVPPRAVRDAPAPRAADARRPAVVPPRRRAPRHENRLGASRVHPSSWRRPCRSRCTRRRQRRGARIRGNRSPGAGTRSPARSHTGERPADRHRAPPVVMQRLVDIGVVVDEFLLEPPALGVVHHSGALGAHDPFEALQFGAGTQPFQGSAYRQGLRRLTAS